MRAAHGLCQCLEIVLKSRQLPIRLLFVRDDWDSREGSQKEVLSTRPMTAANRLNRNEHGIDLIQSFWIVELQYPAFLAHVVFVENPKIPGLLLIRPCPAPGLK